MELPKHANDIRQEPCVAIIQRYANEHEPSSAMSMHSEQPFPCIVWDESDEYLLPLLIQNKSKRWMLNKSLPNHRIQDFKQPYSLEPSLSRGNNHLEILGEEVQNLFSFSSNKMSRR